MTYQIYTRDQAKACARDLKTKHAEAGTPISHSKALELTAQSRGYSSWNHLCARLSNASPKPLQIGDQIEGLYLKQAITGMVISLRRMADGAAWQVGIELDEPVDVVEFDSFSNIRSRLQATVSDLGVSYNKTSDGTPHLIMHARSNEMS